ncbi:HNH endonuclease [Streptomyces kasugaensis]|uniref:HNH endonuclease n=1 Tax=Streptomyces kasugaensis TaxID=1946 RepID=A0A4Q9HVW4_STRKA|nr:HNH endonuclease signature motif containing protein [Streptomyces kasugaensis]TBO59334.1 HNH endonuclease [Streptomyces kasugaensis]
MSGLRCFRQRADFTVHLLEVDYARPLPMGREDVDSNIQVLCYGCHQLKTRTEFGAADAPK